MRRIEVHQNGPAEVLVMREHAVADLLPYCARIRVEYAGVNFLDVYHRRGDYRQALPILPGMEGSGVVTNLGSSESTLAVGDRVAWCLHAGSYSESIDVPFSKLVRLPNSIDLKTAAATMMQGVTAHFLTQSTYPVQSGDTVLIHAAAGGVGGLVVQLAKRRGARVIGTVSTQEKQLAVRSQGADHVINYSSCDVAKEVMSLTSGRGVQVVYDGVGRATWNQSLESLARRGYLIVFGQASGEVPPIDLQTLKAQGSVFVTRPTIADYTAGPTELQDRCREVFEAISSGELRIRIAKVFSLNRAADAHSFLEGRHAQGKVLIKVRGNCDSG